MNFFVFLELGMIKNYDKNCSSYQKVKMLIFECAVTCYRTLFIMSDIKTKTKTMTKTNTMTIVFISDKIKSVR